MSKKSVSPVSNKQGVFLERARAFRKVTKNQLAGLPIDTREALELVRKDLEDVSQSIEWATNVLEGLGTSVLSRDEQSVLLDEMREYRRGTDSICQRLMKRHGVECDPEKQRTMLVLKVDQRLVFSLHARVMELEDALSQANR